MKDETLNDAIFALNSMRKHIEDGKREHSPQHNDHWFSRIASAIADLEAERAAPQATPKGFPAVMPTADWSQAPEWAMWWACDADGDAYVFEVEPYVVRAAWSTPQAKRYQRLGIVDLPLGCDWRLTLQPRDAADAQAGGGE